MGVEAWSPADSRRVDRPPRADGRGSLEPCRRSTWGVEPGVWSLGCGVRWPLSRLGISLWGPSDSGLDSALAFLWLAAVAGLLQG